MVELVPMVRGQLYSLSIFANDQKDQKTGKLLSFDNKKTPALKYFVLDPLSGDIGCFRKEADYKASRSDRAVFIKLQHMLCVWGPSNREEMKKANLHSIELSFANESVLLLGAYDQT